jgi:hypothetical protein
VLVEVGAADVAAGLATGIATELAADGVEVLVVDDLPGDRSRVEAVEGSGVRVVDGAEFARTEERDAATTVVGLTSAAPGTTWSGPLFAGASAFVVVRAGGADTAWLHTVARRLDDAGVECLGVVLVDPDRRDRSDGTLWDGSHATLRQQVLASAADAVVDARPVPVVAARAVAPPPAEPPAVETTVDTVAAEKAAAEKAAAEKAAAEKAAAEKAPAVDEETVKLPALGRVPVAASSVGLFTDVDVETVKLRAVVRVGRDEPPTVPAMSAVATAERSPADTSAADQGDDAPPGAAGDRSGESRTATTARPRKPRTSRKGRRREAAEAGAQSQVPAEGEERTTSGRGRSSAASRASNRRRPTTTNNTAGHTAPDGATDAASFVPVVASTPVDHRE